MLEPWAEVAPPGSVCWTQQDLALRKVHRKRDGRLSWCQPLSSPFPSGTLDFEVSDWGSRSQEEELPLSLSGLGLALLNNHVVVGRDSGLGTIAVYRLPVQALLTRAIFKFFLWGWLCFLKGHPPPPHSSVSFSVS